MRAAMSATADRKAGSPARSVSLCRYPYSRAGGPARCFSISAYPRADSPTAPFWSESVPVRITATTASSTNESHATIARQGWRVLQRPIVATDRIPSRV